LWESIEPALEAALDTRGSRTLTVDGDRELWVGGVAAVDGTLEIRTCDVGARRRLRRRPADAEAMRALGFTHAEDAWRQSLQPGARVAGRGAALVAQAITGPLRAGSASRADVVFEETGLVPGGSPPPPDAAHREHLRAAVGAWDRDRSYRVNVDAGRPAHARLHLSCERPGVAGITIVAFGRPLEVPGFESDELGDLWREVPVEEAADTADHVLHHALGVAEHDPLFLQFSGGAA